MIDILRSQRGGEATWTGLDYQKKYIAYLAIKMLSQDNKIKRITCENLDDIQVEEQSKIVYYQIKSTTRDSLRSTEIVEGIKLFSQIETDSTNAKRREYVLICNTRIRELKEDMIRYQYDELDDIIKKEVSKEIGSQTSFLQRVYLERGPTLREASHVLTSMISKALKDRHYGFDEIEGVKNDLLSHINSMCTGPVNLEDRQSTYQHEMGQFNLKFKSIDAEILNNIIESNRPNALGQDRRTTVTKTVAFRYKILPSNLNEGTKQEIHELLDEYMDIQDRDLRITYLQKFNEYSGRYDLYRDIRFVDFLEDQIKNSSDKHIILECLFVLHRLILTSKVEEENVFLEYVKERYLPFFMDNLKLGTERYDYSMFKIEQILEEIRNLIPIQQLCEMYWQRMIKIIKQRNIENNRLANCIDMFNNNKCRLKSEWRKWLIAPDEYSDIKIEVLKLIRNSANL